MVPKSKRTDERGNVRTSTKKALYMVSYYACLRWAGQKGVMRY